MSNTDTIDKISEKKAELFNTVIWDSTLCWDDLQGCLDANEKGLLNILPLPLLREIIKKNTSFISKGLESGIINDWEWTMQIAVSNANIFKYPMLVAVGEPDAGDSWQHSFKGFITGLPEAEEDEFEDRFMHD